MDTFMGIKLVEHPHLPTHAPNFRFDPLRKCEVGDEFRARMEAWCTEFFGVSPFFIMVQGHTMMAHPESMQPLVEKLRAMAASQYSSLTKGDQ